MLDEIGLPAERCLLIDDSPKNIAAARELGFQTLFFQSPEQLREDLGRLGIL
jgi:FMN phosphatase YigB (HAD superfamily)